MSEARPTLQDFEDIAAYLGAMTTWRRAQGRFSLRQRTRQGRGGMSTSQLSRVVRGERRLTAAMVPAVSQALGLTQAEAAKLERRVLSRDQLPGRKGASAATTPARSSRRRAGRHLLEDWVNVYVKDLIRLRGFLPEPGWISRVLGERVSLERIEKAIKFLFDQGYWQQDDSGEVRAGHLVTEAGDGLPDEKIRRFHRQAFRLASEQLETEPMERRREFAMLMPLTENSRAELKELLAEFEERLMQFAEQHPECDERLYQVMINLTPVGGRGDALDR